MIGMYREWVLRPDQVGTPVYDCFDDCQEFLLIDVVVSFRLGECGRVVCDRMEFRFALNARA